MEKIIIFGTGKYAKRLYDKLYVRGILPAYFADNNANKWGGKFCGIPILNPVEMYNQIANTDMKVCIASTYFGQIKLQLKAMGIDESKILCESEAVCMTDSEDIVLFGAGAHGSRMIKFLRAHNRNVNFFVDNNPDKWNKNENDTVIWDPSILLKKRHLRICITSIYEKDIRNQLLNMGIAKERILTEAELIAEINGLILILFGAGIRGEKTYRFLEENDILPSYFIDNNPEKAGTYFQGIRVITLEQLRDKRSLRVLLTNKHEEEIKQQLLDAGISENFIVSYSNIVPMILKESIDSYRDILGVVTKRNKAWGVVFDCQNGLGLGGIENWTFAVGEQLIKENIDVALLSGGDENESAPGLLKDRVEYVPILQQYTFKKATLIELAKALIKHLPCNLVTCHVDDVMMAGYIVKLMYPKDIRIVSVIHGGQEEIYQEYVGAESCADLLIGVSVDIQEALIERGIAKEKVLHMTCPVVCPEHLERTYCEDEEPIRIAYAGRLITTQKRTELLIPLIEELEKNEVKYVLDIAGSGPLKEDLQANIVRNGWHHKINFLGLLNHEEMLEYWKNKDIFINFSDYEGNSLSMMEAMANGVVPIVTKVSGVKENIKQDYNGYYVELEDIKTMAERIAFLDKKRGLIPLYGKRSHQIIEEKSNMDRHVAFLKELMNYVPPKVSVIVPAYNAEKYLDQCIQSLINQTLNEIEIICVNDGSTDRTEEMLQWYKNKDNRITVISKKNTGYGHSMNIGIERAKGEFIAILESDDFAKTCMLENLYNEAKSNDVEVVKANFVAYQRNWEVPEEFLEILKECDYYKVVNPVKQQDIFYVQSSIWSAIYKRQFLLDNNIKFVETPGASFQDTSFAFKVWAKAKRVYFVKEAYVYYRMNNTESSSLSPDKVFCVCDEYEEIERFLEMNSDLKLMTPFLITKFRIYMWNYRRMANKYKFAFVAKMFEEFASAREKQLLRKEGWTNEEWNYLQLLLSNMNEFYNNIKNG